MGLRTPLYELHVALGAKMVDFGGWDMPLHYGSQVEEHHQVRRDCGVFDVSHMTVVDVAGEQATAYLQHLLANDVARLGETGKALYSAMLNEEGGVVDDLIVYLTENGYRVVVNASTRDKDIAWMQAQAAGFKVDLQERGDLAMLAIQGPNARVHSSELVSPARAALIRELKPFQGRAEGDWFIARTGYTGEDGLEIMLPAAEALAVAGLEPLTLAAKEGLALLNGTQVSTAYALRGLFEAEDLFAAATVCGGLSVEAMLGSRAPFDARIHAARGQRGQIDVAAAYRDLLTASSEVARSHEKCDKVQDPYSLRCQPQVMGACLTQMRQAAEVLEIEANAVSDNPLVFAAEGDVISGGNFHAEPVAMAADNLALALAEIGSLSERRISLMMDMHMSQLPPFLVANGDLLASLPAKARQALLDAAAEATRLNREAVAAQQEHDLAFLKEKGMQIIQPSADDLAAFREKGQPSYLAWLKTQDIEPRWTEMAFRDAGLATAP